MTPVEQRWLAFAVTLFLAILALAFSERGES